MAGSPTATRSGGHDEPRPPYEPTRYLLDWDRTHVWHAFTQMAEYEPFVIDRAEGCVLVDIDGNQYIDGVSSLWCNIHGHRHPKIDAAIRAQLDKVAHVTNLGSSNPTTIRLAKRLADIAPPGLAHVFFSDDGATAVEVAIKMAFQYWRQRPEKGLSPFVGTPEAAQRGVPLPDLLSPRRRLSRRHDGQRERRRNRAIPCHVPPAAVRDASRARPR